MNGQSTDCEQSRATAAPDSNTRRPFRPGPLIRRCGRSKDRPSNVGGGWHPLAVWWGRAGASTTLQTQPEHRPLRWEYGCTALHKSQRRSERLVGSHGASEVDDAALQRFAVLAVGNTHWPTRKIPSLTGASSPPDGLRSKRCTSASPPTGPRWGSSCRW
jgi:hypothetical protein